MKALILLFTIALIPAGLTLRASELTADDVARHLGIYFWKFDEASLPEKFSVALQEIKDGNITSQNIGAFSFPSHGDLVIGISTKDGLLIPTISVGRDSGGVDEKMRRKIGSSVKHHISKVTLGVPVVICADYKSDGTMTVATGKIEDVVSGLALLVTEK